MNSLASKLLFLAIVGVAASFGLIDPVSASAVGLIGAVVAVKSTPVTNADTPANQTLNPATIDGGNVRHKRGICTAANGDSIASTFRFCRIRSSDLVKEVVLDNATWGAACTMDIGLYRTAADGGAVVDADFFASAVDMNAANRGLDVTRESGVITVANMEKRVWQLLGLSSDPNVDYDVTGTLAGAAAAAGAACVSVEVVGG
jgi:uncharacterized membrane protein